MSIVTFVIFKHDKRHAKQSVKQVHLKGKITKGYMSVIFVLIAISITVATLFLIAFVWAVKNGQFEDDITPAVRILFDNDKPKSKEEEDGN